MYKIKQLCQIFFAAVLLSFSASSSAEQFQEFSNLQVHYIALPSTFLPPAVAKENGIERSKYRGLINISVLDKKASLKALSADISGTGKNLLGQTEQLQFKEIKSGDSVYYIAVYPFTNEEIVNFNIKIKTADKTSTLKFQHKFYVE
ncbi:DUF4426 domain-containing protein [Psychromonas ossibalaenae]|uniref:DUF4426 domain-containing protein n=1 Tax=Psychromonas ossibalaenae TaxID=444922 RepID=UPI0003809298|nr:DUF4426 domain-containing protein [Psychromonas ossibalaenae]